MLLKKTIFCELLETLKPYPNKSVKKNSRIEIYFRVCICVRRRGVNYHGFETIFFKKDLYIIFKRNLSQGTFPKCFQGKNKNKFTAWKQW